MKSWEFDRWLEDENGNDVLLFDGSKIAILVNDKNNYKLQLAEVGGVYKKGFEDAWLKLLKAFRKWENQIKEVI